jgi:phospholipase C
MRSLFPSLIFSIVLCLAVISGLAAAKPRSSRIKHIVVLMMENRSFDNLLGYLKADKNKEIDGLGGGETMPRDPNDASKGTVPVSRGGYDVSPYDPKHVFDDIALQMNNHQMNGFVYDSLKYQMNETNPVSMFDLKSAPIINTLALEFAVFDKWFCSIPTSTDPNRAFAMSGTSAGILTNFNGTLWTQQSYFDYLQQHQRSVRGYYQDDLWALGYFQDMQKPEMAQNIHELDANFFNDVAKGDLAEFTWLQPRSSVHADRVPTWQHPDASVIEGERLIKQVYEALRASPKWEETLFLITYDEHGGFADHVDPPHEGVPAPDDNVASNGYAFNSLGVRIPTIAISPWIAKGTVVHEALPNEQPTSTSAFDATSILATSNIILGLEAEGAKPLGNRMAWANTFATLVEQLDRPRHDCPRTLPSLPEEVNPLASVEKQRAKPLNEHLEGQLLFYCSQLYPEEQKRNECPGRPELMNNQGLASDWILKHLHIYKAKVGLGKK